MPLGWLKKIIRPRLVALARRHTGSTRRGPIQEISWSSDWISSHPSQGRFFLRLPPRQSKAAAPIDHYRFRHPAFAPAKFLRDGGAYVAEIRGAYVCGPSVGVITPDRRLLADVSLEFSGWPESHSAMRRILFPCPVSLAGTWALLATTGGDSYYHHMIECTPRMKLLRLAGFTPAKVSGWIVNSSRMPYQRETWQRLGLNPKKVKFLSDGSYYQCERLLLPSLPTAPGRVLPDSVAFLRRLFGVSAGRKPRRLLYLARQDLPSRQLVDEKTVWSFLRSMGFEIFVAGRMTVADQARVFSEARAVVGPHGGAMTNVVFMKPGSLVVEFFHPRYVNPCYWRVAWANQCRYAYLVGEADKSAAPALPGDAGGHIRLGPKGLESLKKLLQRELAGSCR